MAVVESMDLPRGLLFMTFLVSALRISRLLGSSRLTLYPGPDRGQVTT
jgi:hypothetical protein